MSNSPEPMTRRIVKTLGAACLVALVAVAMARSAEGSRIQVPDQAATIQEGLDAGADTVFVTAGTYEEDIAIRNLVVVLAVPLENAQRITINTARIDYPSGNHRPGGVIEIRGLWIRQPLWITNETAALRFEFENCHFEGGIVDLSNNAQSDFFTMRNCTVVLGAEIEVHGIARIDSCRFEGGTVRIRGSDGDARIERSTWLSCSLDIDDLMACTVRENYFTGPMGGIRAYAHEGVVIRGNHLDHLTVGDQPYGQAAIWARGGVIEIAENRVTACAAGIAANAWYHLVVAGNHVLGCEGQGFYLQPEMSASIQRNVVGRCGGDGLALSAGAASGPVVSSRNTSYFNGGSGIVHDVVSDNQLTHNIAYRNGGAGLVWLPENMTEPSCNIWFGNQAGDVSGRTFPSGDFEVDPHFCNVDSDDVSLRTGSPPSSALVASSGRSDQLVWTRSPRRPRYGASRSVGSRTAFASNGSSASVLLSM